jgi:hypothetical protein
MTEETKRPEDESPQPVEEDGAAEQSGIASPGQPVETTTPPPDTNVEVNVNNGEDEPKDAA